MSIGDILATIEAKAEWLKTDADALSQFVTMLPARRDFETKAEAAMDEAERALIDALSVVRKSRAAYRRKQVDRHAA